MSTITFDTLKFVQTLRQSGVEEKQAEAMAVAVRETHDSADLATKGELERVKLELQRDIKELELRLKQDLTLRLGGMMAAAIGLVAALVKLL